MIFDGRSAKLHEPLSMSSTDASSRASDLRWPNSLGFKLALILLLLLSALGGGAYYAAQLLMNSSLDADIRRFEESGVKQLANDFNGLVLRVETAAGMLGELAGNNAGGSLLKPSPPALLEKLNLASLISALGIWPEPNSVDRARDRASLYWVAGVSGRLEPHADYNDPRAVPYYRESWYTPARYVTPGHCYWTPAYHEPLARRDIVSCSMPISSGGHFAGVVTLSVGLAQLGALLDAASAADIGYSLLVDGQGQILGTSSVARPVVDKGGRPRNFAELAQRQPAFNALAIALHQSGEQLRQAAAGKPEVRNTDVAALKTATRDFSSADADLVLSRIRATGTTAGSTSARIELQHDAVLNRGAIATLLPLPFSGWTLIRVLPADQGIPGARQLFAQTMAMAGALAFLLLCLVLISTRVIVTGPLKRTIRKLAAAGGSEDPLKLVLDESPRNELGVIAFWINERSRQLREALDRASAGHLQLTIEAKERRSLIDQLTRFQDRSQAALQRVADAIIFADEHNVVEEMNPAAEQLLGVSLTAGRGRALAEVVNAQSITSNVSAAATALTAVQRGGQLEPREHFMLKTGGGASREIRLTAIPVRSRGNRISGVVLLLREMASAPGAAAATTHQGHAAVALSGRDACVKRASDLIVAARSRPQRHSLLIIDIDQLRRINEIAGRAAGDEAIAKLADTLVASSGGTSEVFHLHVNHFALVLPNADIQRAVSFANALREKVAHLRVGGGPRSQGITISIGIDEFGAEANATDVLLRAADACADAKRAGCNTVSVYNSGMARVDRNADDAAWVQSIRSGLEQNMLRLTTQFVAASMSAVRGAQFESLLALEDEEGFWSPANAFMPAAERHGLAAAVDRWHISNVCSQLLQGDMLKRVAVVSIQISQSSVVDSQLPDFLLALVEKNRALAGKFAPMMSEICALSYPHQTRHLAEVLRKGGIPSAINDFLGRDPATMAQLRQLPVDYLRIDARRFRNIGGDPAEQKLADAALQLARSLHKRSWVYGIDDAAQLETWRRLNADLYQGGAIAKPSPVMFQIPR